MSGLSQFCCLLVNNLDVRQLSYANKVHGDKQFYLNQITVQVSGVKRRSQNVNQRESSVETLNK